MPANSASLRHSPWSVRAVQLDLARQPETVDFIRRFIDFAADHHFNTLVLYIEGRVRTRSFPYLPRAQSYTPEQTAAVVEHARSAGLACVPATATLAHAEHFLSCEQLAHLAEEFSGRTRFGTTRRETFCPSLDATYDFLRAYLSELALIFHDPHLHVGCDEAFNLGFCKQCGERWKREGLGAIFTAHLLKMKALCDDLGKQMWIWDDMYELFPGELERLPRDVVLCHWNYDSAIELDGARAHFANRRREDWLALYQKLGFATLFCPVADNARNIESFSAYAQRIAAGAPPVFSGHKIPAEKDDSPRNGRSIMGALLTQWEMQNVYHEEFAPAVAFAGALWKRADHDVERAWAEAVAEVLPRPPKKLATAVRALAACSRKAPPVSGKWFVAGLCEGEERQRMSVRVALDLLRCLGGKVSAPRGKVVLKELEFSARQKLLFWDIQEMLPAIFDPRRTPQETSALQRRAKAVRGELDKLIANRGPMHRRRRRGMQPSDGAVRSLTDLRAALKPAWERLERPVRLDDWWLTLRLCLPDMHGSPRLSAALTFGKASRTLICGCIKPPDVLGACFYTIHVPFTTAVKPDSVKIEGWGYGGQGVAYVSACNQEETLAPRRIRNSSGSVDRAQALLSDDSAFAYLGNADYRAAMLDPSQAEQRGAIEVEFQH